MRHVFQKTMTTMAVVLFAFKSSVALCTTRRMCGNSKSGCFVLRNGFAIRSSHDTASGRRWIGGWMKYNISCSDRFSNSYAYFAGGYLGTQENHPGHIFKVAVPGQILTYELVETIRYVDQVDLRYERVYGSRRSEFSLNPPAPATSSTLSEGET